MKSHPSKLDLTKPVRTRSGLNVRIVCTDCPGRQPVVGVFTDGSVRQFNADGTYRYDPGETSVYDLRNVPETVRVCFYRTNGNIQAVSIYEGSYWTEEKIKHHHRDQIICFKDIELS